MSRYTLTVEGPDGISLVKSVPSVTEIIEAVLAKPGLHDWYYKQGILGVAILLDRYQDKLPHDVKSLHSLMKTEGLSPYAQRDKAGSQGKAIHKAVEQLANGKDPKAYPALVDWWRGQFGGIRLGRSSILAAEQIVVSFHPLYAGTLDLVYKNDYAITLSDVKRGRPGIPRCPA